MTADIGGAIPHAWPGEDRAQQKTTTGGPDIAGEDALDPRGEEAVMTEEALESLLEALPPDVSLIARFWRGVDKDDVPSGLREVILIGVSGNGLLDLPAYEILDKQ